MIITEHLDNGNVRIRSDCGKMIVRSTDKREFSEAVQKSMSRLTYTEK